MYQNTPLAHQSFMWAIRQEMGWPPFKPANDCLAFTAGRPMDFEIGMELGRLVGAMRKDMIYSGWASDSAKEPDALTVVIREMLKIDVIDRCFPWAADSETPVILVSTRSDESFLIGKRGLLERFAGKPNKLGAGRKLAMKRIRAAASHMPNELAGNTRWVPIGADWVDRETPAETIISFN